MVLPAEWCFGPVLSPAPLSSGILATGAPGPILSFLRMGQQSLQLTSSIALVTPRFYLNYILEISSRRGDNVSSLWAFAGTIGQRYNHGLHSLSMGLKRMGLICKCVSPERKRCSEHGHLS